MRSDRTKPRLYIAGVLLAGFAATAASCGVFQAILPSAGPPPRAFNHEAHIVRGVACSDCHETAEKEARAGMPTKEFCMNCHEELDKEATKPLEKKVAWFLDESGAPRWSSFTKQTSEIRFSHKDHAAKKVACTECHAGIDKDTGLLPGSLQRMDSCTACHAAKAPGKNDCATCHTRIDRNTPPDNHARMWSRLHGSCSRQGRAEATANHCSLCHTKDSCTSCHQTQPPDDHNEFWRLRAHGLSATADRGRCQVCHTTDGCVRCHQSTSPRSHGAGWGGPRNGHCTSCHVPVQQSGSCFACHASTPGHASAPVKPAWHTAGMNCRSCHATTMKHPDNGDTCTACHR